MIVLRVVKIESRFNQIRQMNVNVATTQVEVNGTVLGVVDHAVDTSSKANPNSRENTNTMNAIVAAFNLPIVQRSAELQDILDNDNDIRVEKHTK